MKVYISGPISGTDDYMQRFQTVADILTARGYDVVNPAEENSHFPVGTSWERYMGESLRMLCECDAICMMRNWIRSNGAQLEYIVATRMGKVVMEESNL